MTGLLGALRESAGAALAARGSPAKPVQSNKARPGDSGFGVSGDFNAKHKRGAAGSSQGGKFISQGQSGGSVGRVQAAVGATVTGAFGSNTVAAVRAFQQRHGLKVDGIVGRQTALAIHGEYSAARGTAPGALDAATRARTGLSPGTHRATVKAAAKKKTPAQRGVARVRGGRILAGLEEAPFWDPMLHPKDALGKWADKLKSAPGEHAMHVVPTYDGSKLTFGKSAGGSNGARWAKHADGSRWLVKSYGGNEDRVASELLSNAVYREMGARVPRAGKLKLHNGKTALTYPALEGKPIHRVFDKQGPSTEVGRHFMTDALLANWDVAGLSHDNVLWDKGGMPFRVDQGGTLEFRAQGQQKPFGPIPGEVFSMMEPGGQGLESSRVSLDAMRAQAREIAQTMTPGKIDGLVDAAGFRDAAMRERVRVNLKARVAWMGQAAGVRSPPVQEGTLAGLFEAWQTFVWDPLLHPRTSHGKFAAKLGGLSPGNGVHLDAATQVSRDKSGGFRVVRSGKIVKFSNASDAARHALDKSAKSTAPDSVGGPTSHADYNAFLHAHGALGVKGPNPVSSTWEHFGGKHLGPGALALEAQRLVSATTAAENSTDKYVKRGAPTLRARRDEVVAKLEGASKSSLGGGVSPNVPTAVPLEPVSKSEPPKVDLSKQSGAAVINWSKEVDKKQASIDALGSLTERHAKIKEKFPHVTPAQSAAMIHHENSKVLKGEDPPQWESFGQQIAHHSHFQSWRMVTVNGKILPVSQTDLEKMSAAPKPAAPEAPSSPLSPPSSGFQGKAMQANADSKPISQLGLQPGDVIQWKKGGWKYQVTEVTPQGSVKVLHSSGKTKHWSGQGKPGFVQKADGSVLRRGGAAASQGSGAPKEPTATVATLKTALQQSGTVLKPMGELPEGTVILTPDGKVGVLKPSESAYTGYVAAYDVATGAKFEPPKDKLPSAALTGDVAKAQAAALLAKAQKVDKSQTVSGPGSSSSSAPEGPPPAFSGVGMNHAADTVAATTGKPLSSPQKAAVAAYTNGSYNSINTALRESTAKKSLGIAEQIKSLDEAIAAQKPTTKPMILSRKTGGTEWQHITDAEIKQGVVIQDNGFLSTSTHQGTWSGDVHLVILAPAGSQLIHPNSTGGSSHPSENEVILPRGSQFKVLKREVAGSGAKLYVELMI